LSARLRADIFPPLPRNASPTDGGKIAPRGRGANIPALQSEFADFVDFRT
jgi:hypothetical protein